MGPSSFLPFFHISVLCCTERICQIYLLNSLLHILFAISFFLIAPSFHCVPSYVFESNPNFCNYTLFPALALIFWVPFLLFICWHVTFVVFHARDFLHTVHHIWERGTKKIVENSVWLTGAFDWWVYWGKIGGKIWLLVWVTHRCQALWVFPLWPVCFSGKTEKSHLAFYGSLFIDLHLSSSFPLHWSTLSFPYYVGSPCLLSYLFLSKICTYIFYIQILREAFMKKVVCELCLEGCLSSSQSYKYRLTGEKEEKWKREGKEVEKFNAWLL